MPEEVGDDGRVNQLLNLCIPKRWEEKMPHLVQRIYEEASIDLGMPKNNLKGILTLFHICKIGSLSVELPPKLV